MSEERARKYKEIEKALKEIIDRAVEYEATLHYCYSIAEEVTERANELLSDLHMWSPNEQFDYSEFWIRIDNMQEQLKEVEKRVLEMLK